MAYGASTWSEHGSSFYVDPGNIGVPALIYRTLASNPVTRNWFDLGRGAYYLCVAWACVVLVACLWCCRIRRRDEDPEMELSAWIFGMLLIPSLFWDHYLVLAIPAWLTLLSRLAASGTGDGPMALAAICWGWISMWFLWMNEANFSGLRILLLNADLPPVLLLFALCVWMAKTSHVHRIHPGLGV